MLRVTQAGWHTRGNVLLCCEQPRTVPCHWPWHDIVNTSDCAEQLTKRLPMRAMVHSCRLQVACRTIMQAILVNIFWFKFSFIALCLPVDKLRKSITAADKEQNQTTDCNQLVSSSHNRTQQLCSEVKHCSGLQQIARNCCMAMDLPCKLMRQ